MVSQLHAVSFEVDDPSRAGRFWSAFLGWKLSVDPEDGVALVPGDDTGFLIRFVPAAEPKVGLNRVHFDLTSTSLEDQQDQVARAVGLGARHIDVGQTAADGQVVLADPDDNEFCVIEPGNNFLADCGTIGALSSDGSQAVGYFWSAALGWPLVWDQDEETAIRSPHGGPMITWGGPPQRPYRNRAHYELVLPAGSDRRAEIDRLLSLGATRTGAQPDADGEVTLADPDGNIFHLLPSRPGD